MKKNASRIMSNSYANACEKLQNGIFVLFCEFMWQRQWWYVSMSKLK